ncbi:MAG TPA: hypothetical protein ENI31_01795 [Candidatus Omnitrophica bacterium]|nr:hypothetical protein [Candidatus Omnitrophota bacterium]
MNKEKILGFLKEAVSSEKSSLSSENIFGEIGFDQSKCRLGWFIPPDFSLIEKALSNFLEVAKDKEEFIFVGMGGSINGIKALISLGEGKNFYTLDSLDPQAIEEVLSQIKNPSKTLVISISKSATTLETQLISRSLRDFFNNEDNFLWLSDPSSFEKLDKLNWQKIRRFPIQVNSGEDIGGRFSCPHTLIFLIPLFLIFRKNLEKLKSFWTNYTAYRNYLIDKAWQEVEKVKLKDELKIFLEINRGNSLGLSNWVRQLFQESLGSKDSFWVKTIVENSKVFLKDFISLDTELNIEGKFEYLAGLMYYLQLFIAFLSYYKKINFVNQPYVEVYKKELKNLKENFPQPLLLSLEELKDRINNSSFKELEFIDCILYFWPSEELTEKLKNYFSQEFPDKVFSLFLGSDWNHHSYQSAFKDKKSLYLIVAPFRERVDSKFLSEEKASENLTTLRKISYATFKTLEDKALYFSLKI